MTADILFKDESCRIMGACFEVRKEQGRGFLESVYQERLMIEFGLRGVPFLPRPELNLAHTGRPLAQMFKPDFLCFEGIILEIKAVSELHPPHRAQVHSYLKVPGYRSGLLVNFGHYPLLESERIVC